jgi:hypothetical protein
MTCVLLYYGIQKRTAGGGWMDGEENDKQSDLYGQLQFHYTTTLFVAASHA